MVRYTNAYGRATGIIQFSASGQSSFSYYSNALSGKRHLLHIKTHCVQSRGQEEAAVHDERVSYLHVHVAPL